MLTKLIRIGNSQGVRLSKSIIEQAHLGEELDITVQGEEIVIRPVKNTRSGWEKAAVAFCDAKEDDLRDWDTVNNDFDGDWS